MCIRAPFIPPLVIELAEQFDADAGDAADLLARLDETVFAHPLALARHLVKHGLVYDDDFGACANVLGPIVRDYVRLRTRHGDLFAGTPAALPPLGKPILAPGYARLARQQRRDAEHAQKVFEEDAKRTAALIAQARAGVDRFNAQNVVDLVARRARRS